MLDSLLLPAAALVLVLVGALVVLRLDTRAQRLNQRVAAVGAGAAGIVAAHDAPRSIRVAERGQFPLRHALRTVLKMPLDTPGAHVMPVVMVVMIGVCGGIGAGWFALLYFSRPIALLGGTVAGLLAMRGVFNWEAQRYATLLRNQMPDMIQLLASSVRAGLPVSEAFRAVAREMPKPTHEEFGRVVREIALGSTAEAALMRVHQRSHVPEYAIFSVTLGIQSRSGGRLAETIQLLAETVRQRIALAGRASALAAEGKLSAYVLSVLPFLAGAAMAMTQKGYFNTFQHDLRGRRLLLIGGILLLLGQITMRKLIGSATRD